MEERDEEASRCWGSVTWRNSGTGLCAGGGAEDSPSILVEPEIPSEKHFFLYIEDGAGMWQGPPRPPPRAPSEQRWKALSVSASSRVP